MIKKKRNSIINFYMMNNTYIINILNKQDTNIKASNFLKLYYYINNIEI